MKSSSVLALVMACYVGYAVRVNISHGEVGALHKGDRGDSGDRGENSGDRGAAAVQELVHGMLSGDGGFQLKDIIKTATKHFEPKEAVRTLIKRQTFPKDVLTALTRSNATTTAYAGNAEALKKSREFLNQMVEKAQKELDDTIIACKESAAANRGAHGQVMADIATLGAYIAEQMGKAAEATSCISDAEQQLADLKKQREDAEKEYNDKFNVLHDDLLVKQGDLDVYNFLLKETKKKCEAEGGLGASLLEQAKNHSIIEVCDTRRGTALHFGDVKAQEELTKLLTRSSNDLLDRAFAHVLAQPAALIQGGQPAGSAPVSTGPRDDLSGDLKCSPIMDCGVLLDTLSSAWGEAKDLVDELKKEMAGLTEDWTTLKKDLDDQIAALKARSEACTRQLADATAAKNGLQQELEEKEREKRELDKEHEKNMKRCRDRIAEIVQKDMCAAIVARNNLMKDSEPGADGSPACKPKDIDDCDVTPWSPAACSVECDDRCPELAGCGGTQTLTRDIVVQPNECGIACPDLTRTRKCSQFKCPVDCVMSKWSGWSKCSKECEGGVQQQTRAVVTRHKNGGQACGSVSEARPCNTGSCDRDCSLNDWTVWSPCSMACGGGVQDRVRKVSVPIRGGGKCPKPKSSDRFEIQTCNPHECVGDEICIAQQDLIIAVDGSGSIPLEGFKLVKNFTGELLKRYQTEYYGQPSMQIGMVQFGNGAVEEDGSVTKAVLLQELSTDLAALKAAAAAMEHQKGFTNMAQAFVLAQKLLLLKGRKEAQSAVLTISDGKPSFKFETVEVANTLESKGIMRFMLGISSLKDSDEWRLTQELASQPPDTNSVFVPGIEALQDGGGPFVEEALVKFCPASISPAGLAKEEVQKGYILVFKNGYCGELGRLVSKTDLDPDQCFLHAKEWDAAAFSLGNKWRKGKCTIEEQPFQCEDYKGWEEAPDNPKCPFSETGFAHKASGYDWYAINPGC